jgi:hypothetical protein
MRKNPTKKPYANMPGHFRSSSPARPAVLHSRPSPEIRPPANQRLACRLLAVLATIALFVPLGARAQTPAPHPKPTRPARIDLTKIQPKSLLPKHVEHTEFFVDVNKLGQVTRVRPQHQSDSATFNAQTYGNALQTFIRTPDGHVVIGTYRLTYDFDPKTSRVRRTVSLVRQGGVDPNAKGAAAALIEEARTHPGADFSPRPESSVDPRSLPELKSVIAPPTETPSPR